MTLQQLKYIVTIASLGTFSKAAKQLYMSQPSLTGSVQELEKELGISIFKRTNRGVLLTSDGEEFLGYARQVLEQAELIEEKYITKKAGKKAFAISSQHYSFVVEAFVELLNKYSANDYDFHLRETQTYTLIEDVAKLRSEIGVLYLNTFNETVIKRTLKENHLTFHPLFKAKPHVFLSNVHPLASKTSIKLEELEDYPRLSYEQGDRNSFYFSEEILSTLETKKNIVVCDRATLFNLLIGLNGYTFSSGVINQELNGPSIISIPLEIDDYMEIGYITHDQTILSPLAIDYIEALKTKVKE